MQKVPTLSNGKATLLSYFILNGSAISLKEATEYFLEEDGNEERVWRNREIGLDLGLKKSSHLFNGEEVRVPFNEVKLNLEMPGLFHHLSQDQSKLSAVLFFLF